MFKLRNLQILHRRWKHRKDHWSVIRKKKFPKDRALESLDDFYGSVFGIRWRNMRVALLTEHKYIALVNNFGDTEETITILENEGAINVHSLQEAKKKSMENADQNIFSNITYKKLDSNLEGFVRKRIETETESIYPQNSLETERIHPISGSNNEINDDIDITTVDARKSLERTIEEDSELDLRRLVDSNYGSGALHEFIPASRIKGMEEWIPESEHYKYYSNSLDFPLNIEMEKQFIFPEHLKLFTYEQGNCSKFISPRKCVTGVLSHFLMDGASILPPLFLDIQKGDKVLDACAAPGGKSLIILQTLYPEMLICNDVQESRVNRIKNIMSQYVYDYDEKWHNKRCLITQFDARAIEDVEQYDKILVDVPCTTDRHAVTENDNNIFKPTRIKERLRIPELQASILANCIKLLKPGGNLVYSTCTLSPVQNDGVIHMALQRVFNEFGIVVTIRDLSLLVRQFSDIFKFENPKGLKYGQMVVPFLPANYGPMYFSKITRDS